MTKLAQYILANLNQAGHAAYIVGGYVRDHVLGRASKDIDIATSAHPQQITELFPTSSQVGAHFGVMLVRGGDETVEVATFRSDGRYAGDQPTVLPFTSNLEEDLARRDFTINAMAMDRAGKIIDPHGGQFDLLHKRVIAVGHGFDRFSEDPLRMMRGVRLACELKFRIDEHTRACMTVKSSDIRRIAPERIRVELDRILTSGKAAYGARLMHSTNLMVYLLPEVARVAGVSQDPLHHPEGDVFTHTLGLLVRLPQGCSLTLALAALLHDTGKATTLGINDDGYPTFYAHESASADLARNILNRLRYSNEITSTVVSHVAQHMDFRNVKKLRKSKLYRFVRQPEFAELLELHKLDAQAGSCNMENADFVEQVLQEIPTEVLKPTRLITGHDLHEMGAPQGPVYSKILDAIETLQLEGELQNRDEALTRARQLLERDRVA